jgi:hypothetical protein
MARFSFSSITLLASIAAAVGVACGGGNAPQSPENPTPITADGGAPAASGPTSIEPPPAASGGPSTTAIPAKPVVATALVADLQGLGLDPTKLPRLERLKGDQLRKVMKLFNKSLGVKCNFCHAEDFAAPTPHKRVTEGMWNELVRGMTFANGEPVFCDSCHQGKIEILERADLKALGKWMQENYVAPMKLASGSSMSCAACHGEPFVPEFVHDWETGKRKPAGPASFAAR